MITPDDNGSEGRKPGIGVALGAGGANGLAHISMLEVLDELGIKPHCISGSSIGAVIGALYASGLSAQEIREQVDRIVISPDDQMTEKLISADAFRWIKFLEIGFGKGGLINGEGFMSYLYEIIKQDTFESLEIPLKVIAADLWSGDQVVLEAGELLPAIKASMSLPGVFEPVILNGRALIDGGTVNPVPYDVLNGQCDIVIAIDVLGRRTIPDEITPGYFDTIFNSIRVMQRSIMLEKRRQSEPAIYFAPQVVDVRVIEFYRASQVFEQARPFKETFKRQLTEVLNVWYPHQLK